MTPDLLVCGLGPAGRALAHRALAHGLTVTAVDPQPDRRWTPTYAAWADELPDWLDPAAIAATVARPVAWGTRRFTIERPYAVLHTGALQDSLDLTGVRLVTDRADRIEWPGTRAKKTAVVHLSSGATLTATRVVDARGVARAPGRPEQTAYGVVVPRERAPEPLFMDWRPDNGAAPDAPASFLYAVPLGENRILLEETCLAGSPALPGAVLRTRLHARLRCRDIEFGDAEAIEHVRFPLRGGRPGDRRFGAAAALLHPATGYSVAVALSTADTVVAGTSSWPVPAHLTHLLRTAGLRSLLALPPADLPVFFDAFFTLPVSRQRAYLSARTDPVGTATAMTALFAALPPRSRADLIAAFVGFPTARRKSLRRSIYRD